jgi:trimethylamine--corrinoid protein Co-methyltransferase
MRVNYQVNATPQFRILSDDQCQEICSAAFQVLEDTGFELHSDSEEISNLLSESGALVEGRRVRFPSFVVQKAIDTAPEVLTVYGRQGDRATSIEIRPNHICYGLGSGCVQFLDPRTGERREYHREDAATVARVADALPNIDFVQSLGTVHVHPNLVDVYEFAEMIANTGKPIVTYARTLGIVQVIHQIATAVAGGEKEFVKRPNYLVLGSPASPLFAEVEPTKRVVYCARHRIPYISCTAPTCGGTSPATLAGTLVQSTAEVLTELVIAQTANPGAPFLVGGVLSIMDMRSGILSYGAPELSLLCAAFAEISRYLGLPYYSTAGATDSKLVDEQAALEGTFSLLLAGLSGANMIHDTGFLESAIVGSLQYVVMMDEVIGMVKHVLRGIQVTPGSMATDVIHRVGPGGQYLTDDHTMEHFKTEFWFPTLLDRKPWEAWKGAGEKSLGKRAQEKLNHILNDHRAPPLPGPTRERIHTILAEAEAKAAKR